MGRVSRRNLRSKSRNVRSMRGGLRKHRRSSRRTSSRRTSSRRTSSRRTSSRRTSSRSRKSLRRNRKSL